ncbi:MAG TPA: hypothetical protein VEL76_01180, partial [Gemmataceae bacterium]|nr:hypothetical protein [Gemmataceae bacterium]
ERVLQELAADPARATQLAGHYTVLSYTMYALLVIGGLNTVISLLYYIKVLKVMILEKPLEEVEGRTPEPYNVPYGVSLYALVMAAFIFVVGIGWDPLADVRDRSVEGLIPPARERAQAPPPIVGD